MEVPTNSHAGGEVITHYSHSQHPLVQVTLPELFMCSGCKEYGAGKRFACQQCDFQLHEFCAFARSVVSGHPLHGQHQLVLRAKPKSVKAGMSWPKCDICKESTKGFTYRCKPCSFQMHPCCAMLSTTINFQDYHPHPLRLLPASIASNGTAACGDCNKKKSGRMYYCAEDDYHLHAVCAKSHVNGLRDSGHSTPKKKPIALGTAARVVCKVVAGLVGNLIEGLGEGMAETLAENILQIEARTDHEGKATAYESNK